jgi:hypothetical protein
VLESSGAPQQKRDSLGGFGTLNPGNAMSSFTLNSHQRSLLLTLVGKRAQLVWDINAIYVVSHTRTVKIEALTDIPVAGTWTDVAYLAVSEEPLRSFEAPTPEPFAYTIVADNALINSVSLVRTTVLVPQETIQHPAEPVPSDAHAFATDCGVLITTPEGILPAVQFQNSFGFSFVLEQRLYSAPEVEDLLERHYLIESLDIKAA